MCCSTRRKFSFSSSVSKLRSPLMVSMLPSTRMARSFASVPGTSTVNADVTVIFVNIDRGRKSRTGQGFCRARAVCNRSPEQPVHVILKISEFKKRIPAPETHGATSLAVRVGLGSTDVRWPLVATREGFGCSCLNLPTSVPA